MILIRKKDKVLVLAGKNKGKQGEVREVLRDEGRVLVSKVNFVKRHRRPTQTEPGGIREVEAPLHISNVMLVCPKCARAMRPKSDKLSDGTKVRVCRKCGEMIVS
ncbi:MAG TPA: 50S ribosomal protein L24 [Elusimicrobiota bacterium]|nr:50S ribosomal protein L24 [Elusimicrobiota bacterium]